MHREQHILKKDKFICTKNGDLCGSDLLSEIQHPELVQVVEAGFDHASAEISPVQIHHSCGRHHRIPMMLGQRPRRQVIAAAWWYLVNYGGWRWVEVGLFGGATAVLLSQLWREGGATVGEGDTG